jgi:hypothetical protein
MRFKQLALASLLLGASVLVPVTLDAASTVWTEVHSEHFVLRSHAGVKNLTAAACDLERVSQVLDKARDRPNSARTATAAVAIVAVDSERGLRELLPQFWEHRGARPLGAYWSGLYGHHIVIRVDVSPRERFRRILHEYAHFATHAAYQDAPPWFDEGLSELWTNAAIEDGQVTIGGAVSAHRKLLRPGKRWIPLHELMAATALPPASDRDRLARFYAESWALTHYLVFERNASRLTFGRIPDASSLPSDEALQQYIRQSPLPHVSIPVPRASCGAVDVRELPPLESLLQQARALADGVRPANALPLLLQANALEPDNAEVIEMTGVVNFLTNDPAAAAAAFDRAIATGKASHLSYYYRAVLAEAAPDRSDGAGPVPVADYLRRALGLAPGFAPARERLAELAAGTRE